MNDFTQIKLINSLIDAVNHFYELKQKEQLSGQAHLKGFCEGMAYTLTKMEIIDTQEAEKILQGLGKKRELIEEEVCSSTKNEELEKEERFDLNDLDIPTVFRKKVL
ncbi:MAG: hypothetical protein K0U47_08335 [Epsilonproteobacteria bacterium]|nr:hypothetical protein [Campylobacterota bacterium]